ncbi:helix-turn-helix transcriptional regulator [Bordetella genomosp. 13]|uniref:HTH luxR-type domain-containing protein n=1 Tax=Bordetella genomosp. 13 TaxID=463040 RepID=A0A1W6ZFA1_9BORD|nr:helix-turn-helix transcriptional regulator [Bordetella genomosp. 13]ARP96009.1 hypothetical protein CAL15_17495 [Bordetella genomosp. 13]
MDATTREEAELVGKLYAGILHADRWQQALSAVTAHVGGHHAALMMVEPNSKGLAVESGAALMRGAGDTEDVFEGQGIGALMCAPLVRLPGGEWYISFQRARDSGPFTPEHERALLRLVPHLRESVRLRLRLTETERQAALAKASMDAIAAPLLVVDADGMVVLANIRGERWLIQNEKRLATHGRWQRVLQAACGKDGPARVGACRLQGPQEDYIVATPLAPDHRYAASHPQPLAMVLVRSASGQPLSLQGSLAEVFRLTPAETRLLELLQQDMSLAEAAKTLGVSYATVKTQLASLFDKTGARRQAELLLLVTRLSMAAVHGGD